MAVSNPWLNPLQRGYQQIKDKLIDELRVKVPEITDYSEGNILVLILSIFAAIAEVLHYYIDNVGRETFFVTARKYSSLVKHAGMVDYHIRCSIPSQVDVLISLSNHEPIGSDIIIPANSVFTSKDGTIFLSTKKVTWLKGSYGTYVPLIQKELASPLDILITNNLSSSDVNISLGDLSMGYFYAEGTMVLKTKYLQEEEVVWTLVETFAYSKPTDTHYKVEPDESQKPVIIFGNGTYGKKPPVGCMVTCNYYITKGKAGNMLEGNIINCPSSITAVDNKIVCYNTIPSVGGSDYEDFDMIKDHLPLSIKTLGVAITKEDYEDIAKLTPGVDKAYVNYICGKFVDIYITPDGGGIPPQALLDSTLLNLLKRKVITTHIQVLPTNQSEIYIDLNVTGNKSYKSADISDAIKNALINNYSYNTSQINKSVRLSDLYALIDNLPLVDYLKINNLYIKPIPVKADGVVSELNISSILIDKVVNPISLLISRNASDFTISDLTTGVQLLQNVTYTNVTVVRGQDSFKLQLAPPLAGSYSKGDNWSLNISPNNVDQELNSFSIPVFKNNIIQPSIILSITETV